ncbi:MAG: Yellowstone lake phycodnavirus 3 [Pseudomonadota bacterium]|jgi:hypothetical protein
MKIVFCLPGFDYSREFLMCWTELLVACHQRGHAVMVSQHFSSFVPFARAKCLGSDVMAGPDQKPFLGRVDYDVMMWIDSDVLFNPEMIFALLMSPHPITAGLYIMEDNRHFAAVREWDAEYFKKHGNFEFLTAEAINQYRKQSGQRYMQVSYSGMGLMAIKKGVVEQLKYPYFHYALQRFDTGREDIPEIVEMCSEDVAFCRNLQDAGLRVMLDLEVRGGHQKRLTL